MSATQVFPILRTGDLPRLLSFYETVFGGTVTYRFAHEGRDVYVALRIGTSTLAIGFEPEFSRGDAVALWIYTDDLDATFTAALSAGAERIADPEVRPWGERVAEVRDPEGNHLYVGVAAE